MQTEAATVKSVEELTDVELFQMFSIELFDDKGKTVGDLWSYRPRQHRGGTIADHDTNKVHPMDSTSSPERIARVQMLRDFYNSDLVESLQLSAFEVEGEENVDCSCDCN